ncbi:MAG: hypothetical protein IPP55_15145 [Anaerolineales bacterium]|nr:hypothetical protein [Anaerolineales bacterium]
METGDETGVLTNPSTRWLSITETLQGLEDRITERTNELEKLSQTNAYRASLLNRSRAFRALLTTHSLEQLLPQITETISSQLGFYHVGIFLADVHKGIHCSRGGKQRRRQSDASAKSPPPHWRDRHCRVCLSIGLTTRCA